jgi:hypothetical protein
MPSQQLIKIKFDGQLHQVDANTFINSLINFCEVIKQVNSEIDSDHPVEIKITALEKGSFITGISLQAKDIIDQLFTRDNIGYLADMVTVVIGSYQIKKFLGGSRPTEITQKGDKIEIKDNKGSIILIDNRTYNIYSKNQAVSDAIANNFASLEEDTSISKFEILDDKEDVIFSADRESFTDLAKKVEVEQENSKTTIISANLIIYKLIFDKNNRKWEFYYNGNKISANVIDDDFFKEIDQGKAFSKGDQLTVDLQINQIFDDAVNAYINHSYQVNKVTSHTPRATAKKLPFLSNSEE